MRKTSVIPAAVLAAGFVFGTTAVAEAKHHPRKATRSEQAAISTPAARSHAKAIPASAKTVSKSKAATRTGAKTTAKKSSRKPARAADAVEQIAVETPEAYGPFLPPEHFDYPQPPCTEFDAIIEAHEHEADEDAPEADDVADGAPAAVSPLTRVARTLGSWLRPKSPDSTVRPEDVDLSDLISGGVQIPVEGVDVSRLKDSFLNSRGKHRQHLAIDIGAPKGTPVLAAADGEITSLRREKRGGISLYQKDATGKYLLFYCHLTRYAANLKAGRKVSKGDVIAYVGRTGHVIGGPHLHFSITRLAEDDDNFKAGVAINPYLLFVAAVP